MPRDLRAKLYGYYRSTAAVRIALGLKGLNVSHEFIHLPNGEQISTDYLAISSYHTGSRGLNLAQSIAIIEYHEQTYPDPPLLPSGPASRAIVREVALAVCCDIHPIGNLRVLCQHAGPFTEGEIRGADSIDRGLDDCGQRRESLSRRTTEVGYPTRLPRAATHGEKRLAAQYPNL
jgi:glutathione S-transferase